MSDDQCITNAFVFSDDLQTFLLSSSEIHSDEAMSFFDKKLSKFFENFQKKF